MTEQAEPTTTPPTPVPAWRLIATLGTAGAGAGLLLVFVFQATQPAIQAYKAKVLKRAVSEVLAAPARFETLYLYAGKLTPRPPEEVDAATLDRVFLGFDGEGQRIGFALVAAEPGFQDVVKVIFGYDPRRRRLLGMRVLESKETPGLGDKVGNCPLTTS